MARNVAIFGSTGSIGVQALQVIDGLSDTKVSVLSCNTRIDILEKQIRKYRPAFAGVMDHEKADELRKRVRVVGTEILSGVDDTVDACCTRQVDMVINSFVGIAGMIPTVKFLMSGKEVALANKETLVAGGSVVMDLAKERGLKILPIDSEHSAIFQCLQGNEGNRIERILLTASGGPFRGRKRADLGSVSVEQALRHPNWSMGSKITIDSATMMNKGLEVIEAAWLFGIEAERISVVVHPQSIVHSMVQFEDGSIMAQLGRPDMRIPIQYALEFPGRPLNSFERLDIVKAGALTFEEPDTETFKAIRLAYRASGEGGAVPAVMNGANEMAVGLFLKGKISFLDISDMVEAAMDAYADSRLPHENTVEGILDADRWAREHVAKAADKK